MEKYLIILIIIMVLYYIEKYCIRSEVDKILITKNIIEKYVDSDSGFYTPANTLYQLGGLNLTASLVINNKYKLTADDAYLRLTDAFSGNLSNLYVNNLDISGELTLRQGISSRAQNISFTNLNNGVLLIDNKDNMAGLKSLNGPLNINVPSTSTIQFSGNMDISGDFKFNNVKPILIKLIFVGTSNNINTQVSYSTYSGIAFSGYNRITPILSTNTIQFNTYKDSVSGNWFISFTRAIPSTETTLSVKLTFFHKNFVIDDSPTLTLSQPETINVTQSIVGQVNITWTGSPDAPANTTYRVINPPNSSITNATSSSATVTGLVPGTYTFTVQASAPGYNSSQKSSTPVTLNALAAPGVEVSTTTPRTSKSVTLNITPPINAPAGTGYNITNNLGGGTVTIDNNIATITGLLPNTTYKFTVKASYNTFESTKSIYITTLSILEETSETIIVTQPYVGQVNLTWTASPGAPAGTIYTVTDIKGASIINATDSSATVTGLVPGPYNFEVNASAPGYTYSLTSAPIILNALAEPGVAVSTTTPPTSNSVTLNITPPTNAPTGTYISYNITDLPQGASSNITNNIATISGLEANRTYSFTVEASYNTFTSTTTIQATTLAPTSAPIQLAQPETINVNQPYVGQVNLTWTGSPGAPNNTRYRVINQPSGSTVTLDTNSLAIVTGLVPGTYTFTVEASSPGYISSQKSIPVTLNALAAPGVAVSTTTPPTSTSVTLNITAPINAPAGTSYNIINLPTGASPSITNNIATITGLQPSTNYNFTVQATNSEFTSTTPIQATTSAPTLAQPASITVTQSIVGQVNITWTGSPGAPAGTTYRVINNPTNSSIINATNLSATVTGLVPGTYTFTVQASATGYTSSQKSSTPVTLNALAAPEVAVSTTTPSTSTSVTLNITAPTNAPINAPASTSYNIINLPTGASPSITNNIATITGLQPSTNYNFTVQATNSGFTSFSQINETTLAPLIKVVPTVKVSSGNLLIDWSSLIYGNANANTGANYTVNIYSGNTVTERPIRTQENIIETDIEVSRLPVDSYTVTITALRTGEIPVISDPYYIGGPNTPNAPIITSASLFNDESRSIVTIIWTQEESNIGTTGYRILNYGIPLTDYSNITNRTRQQDVFFLPPRNTPYLLTLQAKYLDAQKNEAYISANGLLITGTPREPLIEIIPEVMTDSGNIIIDWSQSLSANANIDANYTVTVWTETGVMVTTIPDIKTSSIVVTGLSPGGYNVGITTSRTGDNDIISDEYAVNL